MRTLARALALILGLQPALLAAQTVPQTFAPNTVYGRLGVSAGPGQAIPIPQLLKNVIGPNSVSNAALAQTPAATFKCNPSASIENTQDCTIQGMPFTATPDVNNDRVLIYNAGSGTFYTTSPGNLAAGGTAGVSSIGTKTGDITVGDGLTMSAETLTLNVGNGVTISGGLLVAAIGAGLDFSGGSIVWKASTAAYTTAATGGVQETIQQHFDNGVVFASSFGVTCDGTTNDGANMEKFLAAVAASPSKYGIVTGTSSNSVCNMGNNSFQIRSGTTITCSQGTTIKFSRGTSLVIPYGALSGRTYQGTFKGCVIDGQSVTGSVGIDLYDASEWIVQDTYVKNVDVGVSLDGNTASYYNRLTNVRVNTARTYGLYLNANANSNTLVGFRASGLSSAYGIYCAGDQNTFVGGQLGNGFIDAFTTASGCTGSTILGLRMEDGNNGLRFVSGADYNVFVGIYCDGLSGTPVIDSGTGNTRLGGAC